MPFVVIDESMISIGSGFTHWVADDIVIHSFVRCFFEFSFLPVLIFVNDFNPFTFYFVMFCNIR